MLFITLMNFTDQGVRNVKDTVERAKSFREMAKSKFGVEVKDVLWTLGEYDVVTITDAPDEETATALSLALSSLGNVKTQTLRAFTAEEMSGILAKMS
jgi:uncharacterized protein with GYD domain